MGLGIDLGQQPNTHRTAHSLSQTSGWETKKGETKARQLSVEIVSLIGEVVSEQVMQRVSLSISHCCRASLQAVTT